MVLQAFRKLLDDEEHSFIGKMALGTGITVGGIFCYESFEFAKANPLITVSLVRSFGAEFVICCILIVMVNRLITVMEKGAVSNQALADAVQQIASKDDRQAERMELLIQYNAQKSEEAKQDASEILRRMGLHESALDRIEHNQKTMLAGQHAEKES